MYAVIQSGGKQYRVAIGDRFKVESLKLEPGASVDLGQVLMVADGDDVKLGAPTLDSKVEATVVGHGRGEKVRIFKLRRRQNSRTRAGHRQNYTELEITSIAGKKAEPKAEKPAAEQDAVDDAAKKTKKKTAAKAAPADTAPEQAAAEVTETTDADTAAKTKDGAES